MGSTFNSHPKMKIDAKFTIGSDPLATIRSAAYKWTASGSGTDEYYLELAAGGAALAAEPSGVYEDGTEMTAGTVGSLTAGTWDWGDNDSLGFNTVYVRLAATGDPDSQAADFVQYSATDTINVAVQLVDRENGNEIAERIAMSWYLSADAYGNAIATAAPSGGIAIGTDGLLIEWTANLAGLVTSEADGDIDVNLIETGDKTFYLVLVAPDGKLLVSGAINFN